MAHDLLRDEAELQREADALLGQLQLLPRLARHGRVGVVGAKAMGVLVARDIDLHLQPPALSPASWLAVVADLAEVPGIQAMRLHNLWDYGPPDFAWRPPGQPRHRGYLTELPYLRAPGSPLAWHVDLWLLPPGPDEAAALAERWRAAAGQDRGLRPATLQLKRAIATLHLPRRLPSVLVYRAAPDDGVRTMPDLVAALQRREPELGRQLEAAWSTARADAAGAG